MPKRAYMDVFTAFSGRYAGQGIARSLVCDDLPAGTSYRPEFCREQQEQHH